MTELTNTSETLGFRYDSRGESQRTGYEVNGLSLAIRGTIPLPAEVTSSRLGQMYLKRLIDMVASSLLLLMFLPLFLITALAIRINSRGPILFSQLREGLDGRIIRVWKFRTMKIDQQDVSGVCQTSVDDDRVTTVGRLLRRANIDELPQLFNVIIGDMSLIGPRPHPLNMLAAGMAYSEYVPYYRHRLAMRPGITGWAQCNGLRGPTVDPIGARSRIDHDIAYIQNFSMFLDAKIVWRTVIQECSGGTGI